MLNFCHQKMIVVHCRGAFRRAEVKTPSSCIPGDCVQHTKCEIPSDKAIVKVVIDVGQQ